MFIISILAALTLGAASAVMNKASRSRAATEIQAISTACEVYKTDNGVYPLTNAATAFGMVNTTLLTNSTAAPYFSTTLDGTSTDYQKTSQVLFLSLSGQTNFTDNPGAGIRPYMTFKANQVGDPTGAITGASYVKDPWNYSYGYSTGNGTSYPFNGNGFFDLWSTGGTLKSKPNTTNWISNFQ